jgi:hypothetical protein
MFTSLYVSTIWCDDLIEMLIFLACDDCLDLLGDGYAYRGRGFRGTGL